MITYAFFHISELPKVDFDQVNETSTETLRYSLDVNYTFVNWEGANPDFVSTMLCELLTESETVVRLSSVEWRKAIEKMPTKDAE
jgi:hypothetical protein